MLFRSVAEVGARRDLEPAPRTRRPDLEIVLAHLHESHVARGHEQHPVRQLEPLQQQLGAGGEPDGGGQVAGAGLADFMLGLPSTVFQGLPNTVFTRENFVNLYFTDSWKVTPRLTFNFGIRWEPYLPLTVANGQISSFDMNAFKAGTHSSVFVNAPAGFFFPGDASFIEQSAVQRQYGNLAPRGGLAWDPFGDGKTSIRAAYALGYAYVPAVTRQDQAGSNPWGGRSTYSTAGTMSTFADPYAGVVGGNPYPDRKSTRLNSSH